MREGFTTPKERFEAFRLLSVFPVTVTRPEMFDKSPPSPL